MTAALALENLVLAVGDGDDVFHAVDHVDLSLDPGDVMALVGPSGSGKSSLLALAGGLVTPTNGRVVVAGHDLTAAPPKVRTLLRQRHIGFVFQSSNLFGSLTALEQVLLVAHLRGDSVDAHRDEAMSLLEEVGVAHRAKARPHQLSGGERQRVGLARALMGRPEVILADEPTASLDSDRTHEIAGLLASQAKEHGAATLIATHDIEVVPYADTVVHIRDGRLVDEVASTG